MTITKPTGPVHMPRHQATRIDNRWAVHEMQAARRAAKHEEFARRIESAARDSGCIGSAGEVAKHMEERSLRLPLVVGIAVSAGLGLVLLALAFWWPK